MVNIVLNDFAVVLILTALHIIAIVYAWKVGGVFNSKSWNFIIAAFIVLLFNRLISFLNIFGVLTYNGTVALLDTVYIPLIFWILIVIGMMRIFYKIESSINIERKIKSISRKPKRKRR